MGKVAALISFSALLISGCAVQPPITNSQGQPVKYSGPVLSHDDFNGATYVLLEKNIADGKFHTISISKERQPIQNPRQERIVFSGDLTKFAPDYTAYSFSTYRDNGFYGQETVIMNCNILTNKVSQYGPCDSAFSYVFIPTSVTNAYAAGRMSFSAHQQWENPRTNNLRGVGSPLWALRQSGALDEIIKRSPSVGA